jgi:predicted metal-dependent hydrolase
MFEENIPYPLLKIRKMTSRWGVCNRKNNSITLNLELIKWDPIYIDYVITHELSHFVHFNHSASFWKTVSKYCPSYKILRKNLRE